MTIVEGHRTSHSSYQYNPHLAARFQNLGPAPGLRLAGEADVRDGLRLHAGVCGTLVYRQTVRSTR